MYFTVSFVYIIRFDWQEKHYFNQHLIGQQETGLSEYLIFI